MKKNLRYILIAVVFFVSMFANISVDLSRNTDKTLALQTTQVVSMAEVSTSTLSIVDSVKFTLSSKAEASSRIERKFKDAQRRVERRTVDRSISRTERNVQRRIDKYIDNFVDLLDPNSYEYRKWSMQQLFDRLPYGESTVLVDGSKANILQNVVRKSQNGAIVGYVYKKGVNGRKGPRVGFVIEKVEHVEDILIRE